MPCPGALPTLADKGGSSRVGRCPAAFQHLLGKAPRPAQRSCPAARPPAQATQFVRLDLVLNAVGEGNGQTAENPHTKTETVSRDPESVGVIVTVK